MSEDEMLEEFERRARSALKRRDVVTLENGVVLYDAESWGVAMTALGYIEVTYATRFGPHIAYQRKLDGTSTIVVPYQQAEGILMDMRRDMILDDLASI